MEQGACSFPVPSPVHLSSPGPCTSMAVFLSGMQNQFIFSKKKSKINFRQERKGNTDISIINPVPRAVVYGHEQRAASVAACLATCPWGWPFLSASQHAEEVLSLGWTVAHGRAEEVLLLHGAGRSTVHVGLVQLRCGCTR